MPREARASTEQGEDREIPMRQKVGIVMVALGQEVAGEVMKHLSDYEVEEITQSIASLKTIPTDIIDYVLEEFEHHLMAGEWVSQGGIDFARVALERAVGRKPRRSSNGSPPASPRASTCSRMWPPIRSLRSSPTSTRRRWR